MRKPTTTDDTPATYDGAEIITYGVRPSLYTIRIPTMHGPIWITHVGPPIDNDDKPVLAATNVERDAGAWPKEQAENYLKAARTHWITATLGRHI